MFPNFHKSGTIPDCKDALYILVSGFAKIAAVSLMLLDVFHQDLEICLGLYLAVTVA